MVSLLFLPLVESGQESKTETGAANWHAEGKTGAVCVGGAEARDASLEMLKRAGNAADAAVVATLIISVTDNVVCFGGEGPILYYAKGTEAPLLQLVALPRFFPCRVTRCPERSIKR